ncbi:hypothetical protein J31TS3_36690 [Paenibacillus lactis]|nr:hypothetical protein J31TS3_36690 [Paenibacillus lactis]
MESKEEHYSHDHIMESIRNLSENDAKTFLNLIYALLRGNTLPSEQLVSHVLSVYEKKIPRVVKARQNK